MGSRRGLLRAAIVLSAAAMLFSGVQLTAIWLESEENDAFYRQIAQTGRVLGGTERDVDFDALRKINPDIVAWLRCPDTPVDYPIVQRDNSFYLKHRFDGGYSGFGTLFLDSGNAADFSDPQSVVFGHNLHYGGAMLTSIMNYQRQAYYDAHPSLLLYTPEQTYTVELFAACITQEPEEWMRKGREEERETFLAEIKRVSCFQDDVVAVKENDHILTLCTCAYFRREERMLLYGRLTSPADAPEALSKKEGKR